MPVLKDFRATKTIILPSYPDSKVEIFSSILVGEISVIDFKSDNEIEQIIQSLPLFIKSWNFTDEAGNTLEINRENLGFLALEDIKFFTEQITEFSAENKKKLEISPE